MISVETTSPSTPASLILTPACETCWIESPPWPTDRNPILVASHYALNVTLHIERQQLRSYLNEEGGSRQTSFPGEEPSVSCRIMEPPFWRILIKNSYLRNSRPWNFLRRYMSFDVTYNSSSRLPSTQHWHRRHNLHVKCWNIFKLRRWVRSLSGWERVRTVQNDW